jgi:hypothetical protein
VSSVLDRFGVNTRKSTYQTDEFFQAKSWLVIDQKKPSHDAKVGSRKYIYSASKDGVIVKAGFSINDICKALNLKYNSVKDNVNTGVLVSGYIINRRKL